MDGFPKTGYRNAKARFAIGLILILIAANSVVLFSIFLRAAISETEDSDHFKEALAFFAELIQRRCGSPRELKRFLNQLRLLAGRAWEPEKNPQELAAYFFFLLRQAYRKRRSETRPIKNVLTRGHAFVPPKREQCLRFVCSKWKEALRKARLERGKFRLTAFAKHMYAHYRLCRKGGEKRLLTEKRGNRGVVSALLLVYKERRKLITKLYQFRRRNLRRLEAAPGLEACLVYLAAIRLIPRPSFNHTECTEESLRRALKDKNTRQTSQVPSVGSPELIEASEKYMAAGLPIPEEHHILFFWQSCLDLGINPETLDPIRKQP